MDLAYGPLGLKPAEFWGLTLPEFMALARGRAERQRERTDLEILGAWFSASLARTKRIPSLRNLLNPPKTRTLTPVEKAQRQSEFDELKQRMLAAKAKGN